MFVIFIIKHDNTYIYMYIYCAPFVYLTWLNQPTQKTLNWRQKVKNFFSPGKGIKLASASLKVRFSNMYSHGKFNLKKDHNKEPHYLYGIPNPYFLFFTLHIGAHWHCFLCIPCQRPLCQPKQKHRNTCIKDCFSCLDFQNILMTEVDWQPSSESVKFQILEIWRRYMLLGWPSSQLRTAF